MYLYEIRIVIIIIMYKYSDVDRGYFEEKSYIKNYFFLGFKFISRVKVKLYV